MRCNFLVIFLLVLSFRTFGSSLDSLRVEKQNGKKFIVHRVEPKETLYGISKLYDVSIEEIQRFNDGTDQGLNMYQELLIPLKKRNKRHGQQSEKRKELTKTEDTKYHIVKSGETLFAISRLYDLPVDSLVTFNELKQFNIGIGDTIYLESPGLVLSDTSAIEVSIDTLNTSRPDIYLVKAGETLYSISNLLNVSIDGLRAWNDLTSNELSIGQTLIVKSTSELPSPGALNDASVVESTDSISVQPIIPLDTIFVKTNNKPFQENQEMTEDGLLLTNEGIAMKIDQKVETKKYLALHRNAPVGTVIEVKNQMNGVVIHARVVGKLPDTGLNRNVLIRVSGAAFTKLGALDPKIPVRTSYVRPK